MARQGRRRNRAQLLEDMSGFLEEFNKESDRAAGILSAAFLDELLSQLTASFLTDDPTRRAELLQGPLGSFSSRILASYCMGLISDTERHDLSLIGNIRNTFAHDVHGLSFSTGSIRDRCRELRIPKIIRVPAPTPR